MSGVASTDKTPTVDTAKKWLTKRLWKPTSRSQLRSEGSDGFSTRLSLERPQTAPTTGMARSQTIPPVPRIPIRFQPSNQPAFQPPSHGPRTDSVVAKDVNAWLDTSTNESPRPLMEGLSYWQIAPAGQVSAPKNLQYAIPIVRKPEPVRPVTPPIHQVESVYRRGAKKVQARMPLLQRTTTQSAPAFEHDDLRSESMPLLTVAYEQTVQGASPKIWTPPNYSLPTSTRTSHPSASDGGQAPSTPGRSSSDLLQSSSARTSAASDQAEGQTAGRRRVFKDRPSTNGTQRDESMGNLTLSDVPTYSTGPAPPSYCSRPVSLSSYSDSSFGCIDGFTPEQREISQQRAATRTQDRSKEGKVKRLRKLFKKA